MRSFFILLFALGTSNILMAQKKPLDYEASQNWPYLSPLAISNDGNYVAYQLDMGGTSSNLIIEAVDKEWMRTFANFDGCEFSADCHHLIFHNKHDSLGILDLDNDKIKYFDSVKSFLLAPGNDGWLGFAIKGPDGGFCLYNLQTGWKKIFTKVNNYLFNLEGNVLLKEVKKNDFGNFKSLIWVNLNHDASYTISNYFEGGNFTFNERGDALSFLVMDSTGNDPSKTLRFYKIGMDSAITLVNSSVKGMKGWVIQNSAANFGKSGDKIYFSVHKINSDFSGSFNDLQRNVIINNYKTERSSFNFGFTFGNDGQAVVDLRGNVPYVSIIRYGQDTRELPLIVDANDAYGLAATMPARLPYAIQQNEGLRLDLYLVSIRDGSRKLLRRNAIIEDIGISSTGKYFTWYDRENQNWIIYRIKDQHQINVGKVIPEPLYRDCDNYSDRLKTTSPSAEGIAGWLENDSSVVINGRFDLWEVNPDGHRLPINLTGALGMRNGVRFRVVNFGPGKVLKDTILLSAFDVQKKDEGFYKLLLGKYKSLLKLSMGRYLYSYSVPNDIEFGSSAPAIEDHPLKAKNTNIYLTQRMTTNEYPNLFVTTDFRTYKPLTHLVPEKKYNWYSTQLIRYSLPNGRQSEGILFKPENFDPRRKYPVIFYYYERNADVLNIYLHANLSNGCLNIPWFVSNDYLVFVPDIIYYKSSYPGECAYQAVNSAANVLTRFPWVDAKALGLQGHSFGGWETNYIVSHSIRFKAAASASGFADDISSYGQTNVGDDYFLSRQGRLWVSLWQNQDVYIQNSPIYRANRVSTPLFLMHTAKDSRVNLQQAIEFYRALAGLHKKVWLLQYSNEDHSLYDDSNRLDYSIRLAQFFDHYLKGAPAPKWMTEGGNSLDLDYRGKKP